MKKNRLWFLFFLSLVVQFAQAQQKRATNIPPLAAPFITEETPDWARLMYSDAPNVHEVVRLYQAYYKTHTFEKNRDTRNFKHWTLALKRNDYVQADGSLLIPTTEELDKQTADWLELRAKLQQSTANRGNASTSTWEQIGPLQNRSHRSATSCQARIAQSASNTDILYTVSENGILFKTTDHGATWFTISENYNFFGYTGIEQALAVHPTNPDIVYYGGHDKLWKTTDGGTTWTQLMNLSGLSPTAIVIHPTSPNTVLFSSYDGIYRSTDGATFTKVRSGRAWDLQPKTNDPNTLYAICRNGTKSDFYKSTDGGLTWTASISGWFSAAQSSDGGGRMALSTGNPNLIYCFILGRVTGDNSGSAIVGIAKSTDGGATWTTPITWNNTKGIEAPYDFRVCAIGVSNSNDNLVLVGNQWTFKTTDGFQTVVAAPTGQHEDIQQCLFTGPNDMWVLSDGGIDVYDVNLTTRVSKNIGVTGTDFWGFDQGWNEDTRAGSYYHNGAGGYRPSYGNDEFRSFGSGEPAAAYISVGDPNKMWFHGIIDGHILPPGITQPTQGFIYNKYPNEANSEFRRSEIVTHPQYWDTHFLGKDNVLWKTIDGGNSFSEVFTFGSNPESQVFAIEISRSNPNVFYVFQGIKTGSSWTTGILWKSTDAGQTFVEVAQPSGASKVDGLFIAVDPFNPDLVWIAYNKTSSDYKVFKSTNGGASWTNLTTPLLNGLLPRAIIHAGGTNGGIYLMVRDAVFYRNNTHSDWQPFSTGLPAKMSNRYLRPFYKEGKIRVATGDRGLWSAEFFEPQTTFWPQAAVNKKVALCNRDTFFFEDYSMVNHTGASWSWSFPGATWKSDTTLRNPKAIYTTPGTYTATMTLTTPLGTQTSTVTVIVENNCTPSPESGNAVLFDANGEKISANQSGPGNLTHFTMTGWWKPAGTQESMTTFFFNGQWCGHCDDAEGLMVSNSDGKLWYRWNGNVWYGASDLTIPLNEWSYVAMVITPDSASLYLNGKKYVDKVSLGSAFIDQITFGGGWYGSRYFKGQIDEVTMWKRALTDAEIRTLRHITKENVVPNDPNLIGYWQFNESFDAQVLDLAGTNHAALVGGASLVPSTAPVGGGVAEIQNLAANQYNYAFDEAGVQFTMSDCVAPSGSFVATRLDNAPNVAPNTHPQPENYWIFNYYGAANSFPPLDSLQLIPSDAAFMATVTAPQDAALHLRTENGDSATWQAKAFATEVDGDAIVFDRKISIASGTQIGLSLGAPAFVETDPGEPCDLFFGPEKSLKLNGGANYATTAGNLTGIGTTNTITLSAWIKPNGTQTGNAGILFSRAGGGTGFNFQSNNKLGYHWNGGNWWLTGGPTVTANVWSHIALVVEPTKVTMYLDGVAFPQTGLNHTAINLDTLLFIGNDRGNTSRTFNGEMDEVRIYNRALTQAEIREMRHLTYTGGDAGLKTYYKFNEASGIIYDRVGSVPAVLLGNATRNVGTAPFGKGTSARMTVNAPGAVDFAAADALLVFPATGTLPNGELVVSKITNLPDSLPLCSAYAADSTYWIVDNYGTNQTFAALDSARFGNIEVPDHAAVSPQSYALRKRTNPNAFLNVWTTLPANSADAIGGSAGYIAYGNAADITTGGQFLPTNLLTEGIITGTTAVCSGENALLNAELNFSNYSWSSAGGNAATAEFPTLLQTTNIMLTVTNSDGCTGIAHQVVVVNPAVSTDISIAPESTPGSNGAMDLTVETGTAPYAFVWSSADFPTFTAATEDVTGLETGNYTVEVTDANGCTYTETAFVPFANRYFLDADADGYGNAASDSLSLTPPTGFVLNDTDCDDTDASIYPGATETCGNATDDNCDTQIDENCGPCLALQAATNVQAFVINSSTAVFTWTGASDAYRSRLRWREVGTTVWSNKTIGTAPRFYYQVTGLIAGKTYEFQLRQQCLDGSLSPYTPSVTCTMYTANTCTAPEAVGYHYWISSNVPDPTRVNLFCAYEPEANRHQVRWRKVGATAWVTKTSATAAVRLATGLEPSTQYEFQWRTRCNPTVWTAWTPLHTFMTLPAAAPLTGTDTRDTDVDIDSELFIAPNPASEFIRIQYGDVLPVQLRIFDTNSRLMSDISTVPEEEKSVVNIQSLAAGTYILQAIMPDGKVVVKRFVKI